MSSHSLSLYSSLVPLEEKEDDREKQLLSSIPCAQMWQRAFGWADLYSLRAIEGADLRDFKVQHYAVLLNNIFIHSLVISTDGRHTICKHNQATERGEDYRDFIAQHYAVLLAKSIHTSLVISTE